jgi:hypothetical protein
MQSYEYQSSVADSPKSTKEFSNLTSVALLPVSVVAFGSEAQPVERLLRLQSAVAKGVHLTAIAGQFFFRLTVRCLPSLGFRSWQFRGQQQRQHAGRQGVHRRAIAN